MNLWVPPDSEYAKQKEAEAKQIICKHHWHLTGQECEMRNKPRFSVECCDCGQRTTIEQPQGCTLSGAVVQGEAR